jgi:hypothetical protein
MSGTSRMSVTPAIFARNTLVTCMIGSTPNAEVTGWAVVAKGRALALIAESNIATMIAVGVLIIFLLTPLLGREGSSW